MAPPFIKVLPLFLLFLTSTLISAYQFPTKSRSRSPFPKTRGLLELEDDGDDDDEHPIIKKKFTPSITTTTKTKNQSKLIKPTTTSPKNQTKIIKLTPFTSSKNKTKLTKANPSNATAPPTPKSQLKKLNSTTNPSKKSADLTKLTTPKNKTRSSNKEANAQSEKGTNQPKSNQVQQKKQPLQQQPDWVDDDDDDLVSEFRDLPSKFQESFVPDLERITKSSTTYLTKYNKEFARGFKPYVGHRYASTVASLASFAFIVIPLILVSLIFNRIKAYFSLQKLLIFIQVYLSIYFTILCLSSLLTGLEPLRFFYATTKSTYVCVQVLQTLAYVLYLLLLLMYLILVFSTDTALATKLLGLGQTFVGFAVGLHYYMTVFHRAVLREPPKTSWKAHGLYATCFLVICLMGRVDRRKKAYLVDGGEEGKQN